MSSKKRAPKMFEQVNDRYKQCCLQGWRHLAILLLFSLTIQSEEATAQGVEAQSGTLAVPRLTSELPAPQPMSPEAQAELFREQLSRIRVHHNMPIPLGRSLAPFAQATTSSRTFVRQKKPREALLEGDIEIVKNVSVTGSAKINYSYASPISEPTVAARGKEVLVTGNWYAAFSKDGGTSFSKLDPFALFAEPALGRGFCCDQVAIYNAKHDIMVWLLQGTKGSNVGNTLRILVAKGSDIPNQRWRFYDLTPVMVADWREEWFDFPDVAFSDKFLYISSNLFLVSGTGRFTRSVVMRLPLPLLAAYQEITYDYVSYTDRGSPRFVQGASNIMYWASHITDSVLAVYSWPENTDIVGEREIKVERWGRANRFDTAAPAKNGRPWLLRVDSRITAGWATENHIGFAWTVRQDNRYRFPHVRVAIIDHSQMKLMAEPHIWSDHFAFAYPAAAGNQDGKIGMSIAFGGGDHYPSHAVGTLHGDLSKSEELEWKFTVTVTGNDTPRCLDLDGTWDLDCGVWGDYLSVRTTGSNPKSWVTVGFTVQSTTDEALKVESNYVRFQLREIQPVAVASPE